MKRAAALTLALALVLPLRASRAESFVEPATGISFDTHRTVEGRPYLLLGAGVRRRLIVSKVYAMALYVDEELGRRAFPALAAKAGGRGRDKLLAGDRSPSFVVWGDFGKVGVLQFVRNVEAATLRRYLEEGLAPVLAQTMPLELRERARKFIALFERDVKKGQQVRIRTGVGGEIAVEIGGEVRQAPTDLRLARGIWEIWLGAKPVSTELRRALVDRVELLGR